MTFVHLHNHSHYSILEWLPKPKDYVKKAKELWMSALAITDTWNIYGCHEFYKACLEEEIKPILWTEIFVESSLDRSLSHKLVLLAKSLEGYRNIINLVSKASLDNPNSLAKIKFEDIENLKKEKKRLDVFCLSWPISWEIPYYILSWKSDDEIISRIKKYEETFWEENYFLELLYHDDIPKQNLVTDKLIELHKSYDLKVVAANNCYYVSEEDKKTQDIIMSLWTGHELENPDRPTMINWDYSFLSEEKMEILFGFIPSALDNTSKIAESINIEIETWWVLIPKFELPLEHKKVYEKATSLEKNEKWLKELSSDEWYLRYLSFKWLNWRFDYNLDDEVIFEFVKKLDKPSLSKNLQETTPDELKDLSITYYTEKKNGILNWLEQEKREYIERLEYELVVIHEMWFDGYFLIVADYINWARNESIPVWPGRGSAAGSLMSYLSGITDLNPIDYDLIFERFLNPARISMPDIDTDFADTDRDRVVDYCREKYGEDKVAQICTFGTFAARAAVKDVWRVLWVPFSDMNELVKVIPEKAWTKLASALEDSVDFKQAYDTWEYVEINYSWEKTWKKVKYKEIIDNALKIEWNVRQLWVHACAVIIAPEPINKFSALQRPPKDMHTTVTQYSAYPLEDLGLLKMDFLWLRNLTIIKRACKIIKNNKWVDIDILNIDLEDKKVFDIFANGDTTWVFQFESDGMRKYLKDLQPNCFEDLIAMVSLYRPWPMQYIPTYVSRKHWREDVSFPHDSLKDILSPTQWIAVYQEQIMKMVQVFAWFSLWEADILRRAIWKKKVSVLIAQKRIFIDAAKKQGHSEDLAKHIFEDIIEPFAGYGFNKSHAACYAFIAYQTAFLKAYYLSEFLTAIMVSDEENMDRVVLEVDEAKSKNISVLPPSIDESLKHFTYIDDKNIRFWLKAIKWLWEWAIEKIISEREKLSWKKFETLEQFIQICWKEVINKKSLESLILSWSMDSLGERWTMYNSINDIIRFSKKDEKKNETNQIWIFDNSDIFEETLELNESEDMSFEEKLFNEKEVLGFWVSGHPLDGLKRYCIRRSSNTKKLKMSIEELLEIDKKENPEKYKDEKETEEKKSNSNNSKDRKKQELTQAVWVIVDLRKITTKGWKPMAFLKCEWFDYDFEVVIFPKDIEEYFSKLEEWKIVIVSWFLNVNFEYNRKSIQLRDIKIASVSQVREQALDLWLYDELFKVTNRKHEKLSLSDDKPQSDIVSDSDSWDSSQINLENDNNNFDDDLLEKVDDINSEEIMNQENIAEKSKWSLSKTERDWKIVDKKEYIIEIPSTAKKKDMFDLKDFLLTQEPWIIEVFINLKWQQISTWIKVKSINKIQKWISKNLVS